MVSIRVQALGRLRCLADGIELAELPAQRLRCAVLVYLAVQRQATREAIVSLLWPERDDERGRHALSQKLYELRQLLGDGCIVAESDSLRVAAVVQTDLHEFEQALTLGQIEEALALYQGEFLAGFYLPQKRFEEWVDRQRARLSRVHRDARRAFIEHCWAQGDRPRALAHARRWVELEPLEDEAQHRLIELLAFSGQRSEALRQFEMYERSLLAEELEPLDETRALITRIRQDNLMPARAGLGPLSARAVARGITDLPGRASRRRRLALTLAGTFILLVAGGWWSTTRVSPWRAPAVAVLPFLNLSSDTAASQYLSEGLADELINALSHTGGARVAARTSAFRFGAKDLSIRAIGDSLGVSLIIEGTVRREGDRLRVTAQLVDVENGYHLWSRAFDREFHDVLAVQKELARAIAVALDLSTEPKEAVFASGFTSNSEAFDWYLRGRYQLHRGTRAAIRSAIQSFDSAIARDPVYAAAYANLAEAYVIAAAARELEHSDALRAATAAARKAIQLAPQLSEAHAALGRAQLELWRWDAAERETLLAIQLDPRNASAHATHARVLLLRGRLREALRAAELAARLEPLAATISNTYAETLRAVRDYEAAVRVYRRTLELEPDLGHQNLAKLYIEMGQYDSARLEFRAAFAAGAPRMRNAPLLWQAYIEARAGNKTQALAKLKDFQGRQPLGPNSYLVAALYLAVGERERALDLIEAGVRDRNQAAWRQLPWDPIWDPIRRDARFRQLLKELLR